MWAAAGMEDSMQQIDGGVTAAKGFQAAGAEAGIKYEDRKDIALVFTEEPAVADAQYPPLAYNMHTHRSR